MGEKNKSILDIINKRILILDGATGTEMQKRGLPPGVSPELWSMENPEVSADIYRAYARAGSDMLFTCTFGGTPWKLEEFGAADKTEQINCKIAENAVKTADELAAREGIRPLIVGDIGPCGRFIMPFGDLDFEQAIQGFKRQVKGLIDGGVDLFVIETQIDIQESRAALLAVKELCDGFTMVSMTFDETGHSLNGTTPEAMAVTLESLGADVVGVNCSTGPTEMLNVIRRIRKMVQIPVMAKPNAGMPVIKDNETVFPMDADEFSSFAQPFAEAGVNIMGGCCGTNPEHIAKLARGMKKHDQSVFYLERLQPTWLPGISSILTSPLVYWPTRRARHRV